MIDAIVFGDVLEHLVAPEKALRAVLPVLAPSGVVVASIPNVAHGSVRLRLLDGDFSYTEVGLLDRTHVRFFTADSVRDLFESVGLAIVELRRTTIDPLLAPEHPLDEAKVPADILAGLRDDLEAQTYQFVVKAVRDDRTNAIRKLVRRVEAAERHSRSTPDADVLRVAMLATASRVVSPIVEAVVRHEIERRAAVAIDLKRLASPELQLGWAPDLVLDLDGLLPRALATERVASIADPEALAALAPRLASPEDLEARQRVRAVIGGHPPDPILVVLGQPVDTSTVAALLADLVAVRSARPLILTLTHDSMNLELGAMPAAVVDDMPTDPGDLLAVIATASAVVADDGAVLAAARALGVPAAQFGDPADVLLDLDRARPTTSDLAAEELRLDRLFDALVPATRADRSGRDEPEQVRQLRLAHENLQARVVQERTAIASVIDELESRADRREQTIARLQLEVERADRLQALLDREHVAIAELQEAAVAAASSSLAAPRPSTSRRVARRLRGLFRS
jgi:hypothetical protein